MSKTRSSKRPNRSYKRRSRGGAPPSKKSNRSGLIALTVAVVVALGGLAWYQSSSTPSILAGIVETYPSEGAQHVPVGQSVVYKTDPPNSGAHYAQVAPAGFYEQAIPDELLVHNLEHGHVIIFYDPTEMGGTDEDYITMLTNSYTGPWDAVVAVPRQGMDHPYVLAAWRRLLRLDELDQELVDAFIDAYRGRGPENPVR